MGGSSTLRLLFAVTLYLSLTSAISGIEDLNQSVSLPTWKPSAEYITKCDFNSDRNPFCGWTHLGWIATPQGSDGYYLLRENSRTNPFGVTRLESDHLTFSGAACLEFWYRASGSNGTDLRVLIRDDVSETEIWTSQTTADRSWQQVFIPLQKINRIQVVFESDVGFAEEGIVTIDNVGVRIGPCGEQCSFGEFWADDACTTECACSAPGPQLTCSPASCPDGHTCRRSNGAPVCLPNASGTCSLHDAPHITTFDGASHRFAGSCNYVLAKLCSDSASVPFFQVEVRHEQRGDSRTSSIQQVNMDLQGLTVSLLRWEAGRVLVNGIWKSLPLSLKNGAVMVSSTGAMVILETDFELMVSYDATSGVQVKVPALYGDQVCGLCGNFNHQSEDDLGKPDGTLAVDTAELAESWQSAGDACDSVMLPDHCPLAEEAKYESEANCGVILSKESPFAGCSSVITAEVFFRSCVFEMCAAGGDPQAMCDVLQTFATACQSAGVTLPPWRNATDCPLVCQANSHYDECASGCPATCSDEDSAMSCGVCEERCDCDPGFLLSGGKCVPADDCGCWINGQHVEKGRSVMQADCETECQCMGHGKVQCSPVSCGEDKVCRSQDGVVGCFTPRVATCHAYGDPHYLTYDGKLYNFQGACNYTLAKTCGQSPVQFTVTGRNEDRGNQAWSALNSVALEMKGLHLALRKGKDVYVNGALTQLPAAPMTGIKVVLSGAYVQVDTDFGLQLLFDGDHRLFVRIDERHWAQMCGLCGTYSGSQFDDFLTPDGVVVSNPDEFANSWRVKDSEWPCSDSIPPPAPCESWLENDGYQQCSILFGDIFKVCHEFEPVQLYVNSCMYDHCATRGDARQLCTSLESYVAACELAGVNLGDWRDKTICANFKPTPTDISTTTHSHAACPLDCNFDGSECGWTQTITDSFDWTRRQGSTPTELTGPSHDHTTGSGSYMYIEADGVYRGDSARMISPLCQVTGPHCLQFWYHMYGSATAMALNIYLLEAGKPTKIWGKANNQGNAWTWAQVDFKVGGPFQVIIEGLRGSDQRSDVAFDDLSILAGKCSGPPNAGPVSSVAPSTYSTPPTKVCSLDCNFESDLCTWEQLLTDSFDWTRRSGPTPTSLTGPSVDHTTGAGHYLYIEGDGVYNGDTARLLSSECSASGPHCLQFWYHIYGTADTMGLTAYLLEGRLAQRVWSRRNNRGDAWHLAQVDINPSGPFQIIFEGRRGTTTLSDVALDDVSLQRGSCSDLIMASTPQPPAQTPAVTQAPVPPTTTTQRPVQTTTTTQAPVPTTTATQAPVSTTTTTQWPVQTTTTTQTPVQTTKTTQRPVQPNTTHKPVPPTIPTHKPEWPHTTHHPVPTTTTTQRPVQPNITQKPVQPTATTQQPVQTTTTTQAPVPTTSTTRAPVSTTTTTQQPVQTTTTTQHPVQPNTSTQGPVQTTRTTQAPVQNTTTTQRPVQPNTTHKPVPPTIPTHKPEQPHTTHYPVPTTMITQRPVQPNITQKPVQPTATTQRPVQPNTTHKPVPPTIPTHKPEQPHTTHHPVPTTMITQRPVQPNITQKPVQPTATTQRPVQPNTTHKPVPPTIPTHKPEQPHTTHHPVPTTMITQRPVQPNITQKPVQPTATTQRPVQPNTTHKPVPPTIPTHKPEQPHTTHHPVDTTMTTQRPVQPTETTKRPVPTTASTQHPVPTTETTQGPVQTTTTTQLPAHTTTTTKPPATSPVPSCKANSHYIDCAPSCVPTCIDLKNVTCIRRHPCQPGCVCDDGFVRKWGKCVPIQVCGCRDDDGQNRNFGELWTGSHCAQRCKCQRENGMGEIVCEDYECGPKEVCHLSDKGDFKCKYSGFSECSIAGDPEYRTFDDRKHDFEGKNSYILVQTVNLPQNLPDVYVVGINKKGYDDDNDYKDSRMARDDSNEDSDEDSDEESDEDSDEDDYTGRLRQLKIRVYNHTIEFKAGRVVVLDGEKVSAPFTPFLGIKILERSSRIYLKTDFGLSVEFDGDNRAEIILPNAYKKKVGGLCGNFDDKKRNDFMKPDGSQAKDVKDFGDSWRVTSKARTMK